MKKRKERVLYAICYEIHKDNGDIEPRIEYTHGTSAGLVALNFGMHVPKNKNVKVVHVAPAVGYHVLDDNADRLKA
jgi:hypothetical protein